MDRVRLRPPPLQEDRDGVQAPLRRAAAETADERPRLVAMGQARPAMGATRTWRLHERLGRHAVVRGLARLLNR